MIFIFLGIFISNELSFSPNLTYVFIDEDLMFDRLSPEPQLFHIRTSIKGYYYITYLLIILTMINNTLMLNYLISVQNEYIRIRNTK